MSDNQIPALKHPSIRATTALLLPMTMAMLFGGIAAAESEAVLDFGAPIALQAETPLKDVVAHPERYADSPVLIKGRITDVCQKKGCWTVLADGDATLRIRFKDYGFFLPRNATGKVALAEGVVRVEVQSQRTARHYASESRNGDPDAIVGEQRVVAFTASGVRLVGSLP